MGTLLVRMLSPRYTDSREEMLKTDEGISPAQLELLYLKVNEYLIKHDSNFK